MCLGNWPDGESGCDNSFTFYYNTSFYFVFSGKAGSGLDIIFFFFSLSYYFGNPVLSSFLCRARVFLYLYISTPMSLLTPYSSFLLFLEYIKSKGAFSGQLLDINKQQVVISLLQSRW